MKKRHAAAADAHGFKLPTMLGECEKVAWRAGKENLDHLAFLL